MLRRRRTASAGSRRRAFLGQPSRASPAPWIPGDCVDYEVNGQCYSPSRPPSRSAASAPRSASPPRTAPGAGLMRRVRAPGAARGDRARDRRSTSTTRRSRAQLSTLVDPLRDPAPATDRQRRVRVLPRGRQRARAGQRQRDPGREGCGCSARPSSSARTGTSPPTTARARCSRGSSTRCSGDRRRRARRRRASRPPANSQAVSTTLTPTVMEEDNPETTLRVTFKHADLEGYPA